MKLTTTLVTEILNSAYPDIEWYVNFVPEAEQTIPSLPLGRVVELGSTHSDYASNKPWALYASIQVDVWVKTPQEAESMYYEMDKLFMNNESSMSYSEIGTDPDLQNAVRIIKRYYIRRDIQLG